jgi:thiol-disulfide isomerase/thioredoxin
VINRQKFILALLLWLLGCKGMNKDKSVPILSDPKFDKVRLSDLENKPIDLKQYKGKTIFLNFWATWCKPCLQEMPSIQRMMGKMKSENIVFLFASDETIEQIEEFKKRNNYPFHFVRAENMEELKIMVLPTTYIFDPLGKLVYDEMGYRQWDSPVNLNLVLKIAKEK